MGERRPERLRAAGDAGDGLPIGLLDIIFERHGGRTDIGALSACLLGALATQLGEREAITDTANEVAARHLHAFLVLEEFERFLDDFERQAQKAGQVQPQHAAARVPERVERPG